MNNQRFLSHEDVATLSTLAEHLSRGPDSKVSIADELLELVSTSVLLPEHSPRSDCVRLYSQVTYRVVGSSEPRVVCIVSPHDNNDGAGRISIFAPLALSLVGRPAGSVVEVSLPFDKRESIEIIAVDTVQ